jgi:hypothetical protein
MVGIAPLIITNYGAMMGLGQVKSPSLATRGSPAATPIFAQTLGIEKDLPHRKMMWII